MNKKQYQKLTITVGAGSTYSFSDRLRSDFDLATGVFFYSTNSLDNVTCDLRIGSIEILPTGTDASLFRWTDTISRNEALWDFYSERIEAKGAAIEGEFRNEGLTSATINIYVLLENEQ